MYELHQILGPDVSSETTKQRISYASTKNSNVTGPSNGGASFAEVAEGVDKAQGGMTGVGAMKGKNSILGMSTDTQDQLPKMPSALTLNLENINSAHSKSDSGVIQFSIHINLKCGPDDQWSVLKASIENQSIPILGQPPNPLGKIVTGPSQVSRQTEPIRRPITAQQNDKFVRAKPKFIWRSRSGPGQSLGNPSTSKQHGSEPSGGILLETALIPILPNHEPQVEIRAPLDRVEINPHPACVDHT